jgi:hypothetical protein
LVVGVAVKHLHARACCRDAIAIIDREIRHQRTDVCEISIGLFNYNTTVKIDDTTWGDTNPGVWTHSLHSLMDRSNFTSWDKYTEDTPL